MRREIFCTFILLALLLAGQMAAAAQPEALPASRSAFAAALAAGSRGLSQVSQGAHSLMQWGDDWRGDRWDGVGRRYNWWPGRGDDWWWRGGGSGSSSFAEAEAFARARAVSDGSWGRRRLAGRREALE